MLKPRSARNSKAVKMYRNAVAGALMMFQSSTADQSKVYNAGWDELEKKCREDGIFEYVFQAKHIPHKNFDDRPIRAAKAALRGISEQQYISTKEAHDRYHAAIAEARKAVA